MPQLVALDLPGGAPFVDALRRVWDAGDAAAPLDPRLPAAARRAAIAALAPGSVVDASGERSALDGGRPVEPGDALVLTTSGSTGTPRGVVLTHDAVAASAHATTARLGVDPLRHHWLACLPLAHIGGLSVVTRALLTDTPLTVVAGFDAAGVEELGRSGGVTHVSLVATALQRLDASVFDLVLLGGAAPPGDVPDNVVATYGMTETGSGVVYDGRPLEGVDIAIGDGTEGEPGEILVRCPMLLRAYRDGTDPRRTGSDGSGGWLATGDAGRLLADGTLAVDGRLAEVIVTGGEKVWPAGVEAALANHPKVAEVAVWRRADPEWGQRVVAWVVPAPEGAPTLDELVNLVRASLPPWAAPKELVLVTSLPRTGPGKVARRALS
jgi:O-succinylbenzoic acid--CoA ligase